MSTPPLDREEYVEQEYFFRLYRKRLQEIVPSQEILQTIHDELLATTRLPLAIDFLRAEILHHGRISGAMTRLAHDFAPFQAFVIRCIPMTGVAGSCGCSPSWGRWNWPN
jgi:hypothetical protein